MKYIVFDDDNALELQSVWIGSIKQQSYPIEYGVTGWWIWQKSEPIKIEIKYEFCYGDRRQSFHLRSKDLDVVKSKWKELIDLVNQSTTSKENDK